MPPVKKIVAWFLAVFCLYAILVSPTQAAAMVGNVGQIVGNGVGNVAKFFDTLINR